MLAADFLRDHTLHLVDVLPDRGHPVGVESLGHVPELIPMHRRGRQPDFSLEWTEAWYL